MNHHVSEGGSEPGRLVRHEPLGYEGVGLVHDRELGVAHQGDALQHRDRTNDQLVPLVVVVTHNIQHNIQ